MTNIDQEWEKNQKVLGASFFQSSYWGRFQESLGNKVVYLSGPGWSCLGIIKATPAGSYIFSPYGPTLAGPAKLNPALKAIKQHTKSMGISWLRLEPVCADYPATSLKTLLKKVGARHAPREVEPGMTSIVNLTPDADALLASLHRSARLRIKKNMKSPEVEFKTSTNPADVSSFWQMLKTVEARNSVRFFAKDYFSKQAEILMPLGVMYCEQAYIGGEQVGAILMHVYGGKAYYTYAATAPEARGKNVSELLLWQAMLNAKALGATSIDLYGMAPEDAPSSHPWYGFSVFKRKFRGQIIEYAGTWDVPVAKLKYSAYRLVHKIRSTAR